MRSRRCLRFIVILTELLEKLRFRLGLVALEKVREGKGKA